MIDLHTHTLHSDGVLLPSEMARRAASMGYRAIAFTDHVDSSNISVVIESLIRAAQVLNKETTQRVIPGVELTHIPPSTFEHLTKEARRLGARLVVAHGETIVEPVMEGTNMAAILANVDILAHPGLISDEEVILAKERGVYLEITARAGHSLTNGHVARLAIKYGAKMVIDTDSHSPSDLITRERAKTILLAAGIPKEMIEGIFENSERLVNKAQSGE